MNIDITQCTKINVIDSCAIWNILSSKLLYSVIIDNRFDFIFTKFVEYECLYKSRSVVKESDVTIQQRLREEIKKDRFKCLSLTIEDLQERDVIDNSNVIGIGELSSIAYARKINQCFLTDDQKARKVGVALLGKSKVQTTPLIVGWLLHNNELVANDVDEIINQHNECGRPLEKYLRLVHEESIRIRYLIN